jgi:hypothetical protein
MCFEFEVTEGAEGQSGVYCGLLVPENGSPSGEAGQLRLDRRFDRRLLGRQSGLERFDSGIALNRFVRHEADDGTDSTDDVDSCENPRPNVAVSDLGAVDIVRGQAGASEKNQAEEDAEWLGSHDDGEDRYDDTGNQGKECGQGDLHTQEVHSANIVLLMSHVKLLVHFVYIFSEQN